MTADPRSPTRRKLLAVSGSVALFGLAGCLGDNDGAGDDSVDDDTDDQHDDGEYEPGDHDVSRGHFDEIGIGEFEILDRAHDPHEEAAYMHGDHWHGDIPTVPLGDNISLGAAVEDEDGNEIELGDEYELLVDTADGADDSIVSFAYHGDHVHIVGEQEGITEVVFLLWHGDHVDYQTDAITVQVSEDAHGHDDHHDDDHHHGHADIGAFDVLDRAHDPHERVAYVHGDHWHGELPTVPLDGNVSLGATVEDDDGHEIDLDGDLELRVRVADGADDSIVSFDYHGDHVHIIGEQEGVTEVVFQLWHDDHADYETPAITVQVAEDP